MTYNCSGYLFHFLKKLQLLLVPARRIHNDYLKALILELFNTFRGDLYRIIFGVAAVEWNLGACGILLQLVESTRTKSVRADKCSFPALFLVVIRQLTNEEHENDIVDAMGKLPLSRMWSFHYLVSQQT